MWTAALQSHESGVNVVANVTTTLTTIATTKQATDERQKRHTPAFRFLTRDRWSGDGRGRRYCLPDKLLKSIQNLVGGEVGVARPSFAVLLLPASLCL